MVEEGDMDMDDDDEGVRVMAAICCCPSYCKSTLNRRAFVDRHDDKNLGHTPYHSIPELCTNKAITV